MIIMNKQAEENALSDDGALKVSAEASSEEINKTVQDAER
jgi:hypothetical protein